ncbi:MAG: hypothetical protein C5B50_20345 [Verrucomicrobia bacterium]|nr:MAG: hypothetical protein C5B50_20345 [Verrucomicrobiota bacterium]
MIPRKKRNSSKVNLIISAIFHGLLVVAIFFFAAREGILGKKLKEITVTLVPKEKKPEPPKEKPAPPKVETPKVAEAPKTVAVAPPRVETHVAPPPPADIAPAVAPPPAALPAFSFSDGAHDVQSVSDPNLLYKGLVEHTLRSRWQRPEDIADDNFAAEVELNIDPAGQIKGYLWQKGSGNTRWDDSVKNALAKTKAISRPPPKNFPPKFLVRFDVERLQSEEAPQLSVQ